MSFGVNDESRAREAGAVSQGIWRVAAEQSRIDFKVRKMGLYFVKGSFKRLSGSVEVGPDGMPTGGTVRIDASSVTTRLPPRDWHLRTRDFLSVRQHPEITITVECGPGRAARRMFRSPWNFVRGDPVREFSQAGEAATSGAAVAIGVRRVSPARLAATSRSTGTASLASSLCPMILRNFTHARRRTRAQPSRCGGVAVTARAGA
jgi:hypothetical protein